MQSQIDNLIAGQFNAEDNLELSAELEELMSGSVQAKATTQISLPAVPTHQVHVFPEIPTGVTNSAEVDAKFSEDANNATRAVPA